MKPILTEHYTFEI